MDIASAEHWKITHRVHNLPDRVSNLVLQDTMELGVTSLSTRL